MKGGEHQSRLIRLHEIGSVSVNDRAECEAVAKRRRHVGNRDVRIVLALFGTPSLKSTYAF